MTGMEKLWLTSTIQSSGNVGLTTVKRFVTKIRVRIVCRSLLHIIIRNLLLIMGQCLYGPNMYYIFTFWAFQALCYSAESLSLITPFTEIFERFWIKGLTFTAGPSLRSSLHRRTYHLEITKEIFAPNTFQKRRVYMLMLFNLLILKLRFTGNSAIARDRSLIILVFILVIADD